jgi:hypothetical protein
VAQRRGATRVPEAHQRDGAAVLLGQLHRALDGELAVGVDHQGLSFQDERPLPVKLDDGLGVYYLLDAYDDVHLSPFRSQTGYTPYFREEAAAEICLLVAFCP